MFKTFLTEPREGSRDTRDIRIKAYDYETAEFICPNTHRVIGILIREIRY